MSLNPELLELLACPQSHAPLVLEGEFLVSTDPETRKRYKVEDGIPNMLLEEAEEMAREEWEAVMKRHGKDV